MHLHVDDLAARIAFYSQLFAIEPSRREMDYAEWMLEDTRINFANSARGAAAGIDHLGIQTDDAAELDALRSRARSADLALLDEGATSCCYARSEKHWIADPQCIAWEHFHALGDIPLSREAESLTAKACCAPTPRAGLACSQSAAGCC